MATTDPTSGGACRFSLLSDPALFFLLFFFSVLADPSHYLHVDVGASFSFIMVFFSLLHASFWFRFACVVSWLEILYLVFESPAPHCIIISSDRQPRSPCTCCRLGLLRLGLGLGDVAYVLPPPFHPSIVSFPALACLVSLFSISTNFVFQSQSSLSHKQMSFKVSASFSKNKAVDDKSILSGGKSLPSVVCSKKNECPFGVCSKSKFPNFDQKLLFYICFLFGCFCFQGIS